MHQQAAAAAPTAAKRVASGLEGGGCESDLRFYSQLVRFWNAIDFRGIVEDGFAHSADFSELCSPCLSLGGVSTKNNTLSMSYYMNQCLLLFSHP